MNLRLCELPST